jgi:hypothetical protein
MLGAATGTAQAKKILVVGPTPVNLQAVLAEYRLRDWSTYPTPLKENRMQPLQSIHHAPDPSSTAEEVAKARRKAAQPAQPPQEGRLVISTLAQAKKLRHVRDPKQAAAFLANSNAEAAKEKAKKKATLRMKKAARRKARGK